MRVVSKLAICLSLLAVSSSAFPSDDSTLSPETLAKGKTVFMGTCFACHGADGKGLVPGTPNLRGKKSPLHQEDPVLIERILNGYQSKGSPMAMPPKGGNPNLNEEDIEAVVAYMKDAFLKEK